MNVVNKKRWNGLTGQMSSRLCSIWSRYFSLVKDLVPNDAYTGEYTTIAGIHAVARRVPVARILVALDDGKFWVKAAVLESAPRDLLLGAACEEQLELFKEALRTRQEIVNSVLTGSKACKEEEDVNLDQEADVKQLARSLTSMT